MASTHEVTVWRPSMVARVGIYAFATYMVVMGAAIVADLADEGAALQGALFAVVVAGGPATIAVAWVHRSRIVCSSVGVEVVNLLSRRQLGWDQIVHASPRSWGIELHLSDGGTLHGRAVQKPKLLVWLKRNTRADELANYINGEIRLLSGV